MRFNPRARIGQRQVEVRRGGGGRRRPAWFDSGLEQGSLEACDTFSARRL